jgi:hemerythrin-like domain-containing protein
MTNPTQPNVALSLRAIHMVITRALKISIENSNQYAMNGFPEGEIMAGYLDYLTSLKTSFRAHHQAENSILFPALRKVLPDVPYKRLIIEHHTIDSLLNTLQEGIECCQAPVREQSCLETVGKSLLNLQYLWRPHILIEEGGFTVDKLEKLLPVEEHLALLKSVGEFNQANALPAELIIPFTIYNLAPMEREIITGAMPPEVVEHLVPVAWKEKWAAMKPFLLD